MSQFRARIYVLTPHPNHRREWLIVGHNKFANEVITLMANMASIIPDIPKLPGQYHISYVIQPGANHPFNSLDLTSAIESWLVPTAFALARGQELSIGQEFLGLPPTASLLSLFHYSDYESLPMVIPGLFHKADTFSEQYLALGDGAEKALTQAWAKR